MTAQAARPTFVVLNTHLQGAEYAMAFPASTLGRNPDCEIPLDQASVSRRHARVEEAGGRFMVRDLGSRNGIKINEIDLPEAELRHGDVLTIGEVRLRFSCPGQPVAAADPGSPAAATLTQTAGPQGAAQGRELTGGDIVAAAQALSAGAPYESVTVDSEEPPTGPTRQTNVKLVFSVLLGLIVSLAGAGGMFYLLMGMGGGNQPKRMHVLLQVGERRWVQYPASDFGDFREDNIAIEDDSVADVQRFDSGELLVIGRMGGTTAVTVHTVRGFKIPLRIVVRGRMADPLRELTEGVMSADERRRMGDQFVRNGLTIEAAKPYLAMQEYEKAMAVLKPLSAKGPAYIRAKNLHSAVEKRIAEEWARLANEGRLLMRGGQLSAAVDMLDRAIELIPDPADPRHQKAAGTRYGCITRVRAQEDKNRSRGRKR